jgi:hypothetical protein
MAISDTFAGHNYAISCIVNVDAGTHTRSPDEKPIILVNSIKY